MVDDAEHAARLAEARSRALDMLVEATDLEAQALVLERRAQAVCETWGMDYGTLVEDAARRVT